MIEAQNQLGYFYLLSRNLKKAKEQAEIVLAIEANNSSAYLLLSNISLAE
jgi:Tfp pilus assembly protein PilF